jgi:hypothetical protein
MVWRATPAEAKRTDGTSPKAAMKARITAGTAVGLLGYLEKEPVAWCSVAPRSTYRRLVEEGGEDKDIWSIVCFFVVRRLRGQRSAGVSSPPQWSLQKAVELRSSNSTPSIRVPRAIASWASFQCLLLPAFEKRVRLEAVGMSTS